MDDLPEYLPTGILMPTVRYTELINEVTRLEKARSLNHATSPRDYKAIREMQDIYAEIDAVQTEARNIVAVLAFGEGAKVSNKGRAMDGAFRHGRMGPPSSGLYGLPGLDHASLCIKDRKFCGIINEPYHWTNEQEEPYGLLRDHRFLYWPAPYFPQRARLVVLRVAPEETLPVPRMAMGGHFGHRGR